MKNVKNAEMINKVIDPDLEKRDILESEIPKDVLDILLKDRTTGKNILWMTDSYEHLESTFDIKMGIHDPIDADTISRPGNKIIRPRVDKSKEEQRARVQKKAEVFTPSWICNNMNNLIDAAWFGRKTSPFTVEGHKSWRATKKPIVFPKKLKKTWLDFVTEVRLEITCGEAPFLVSRYDTTTGEVIPIPERIGILDRKLRIVTENVRGKPKVTKETLLDGTVETHIEECPGCSKKGNRQHFGTYCKIMDWNTGEPVEFRAIAENGGGHG